MFNATRYTSSHLTISSTTRRMARGLLVAPLLLLGGAQLLSGCQDVSEPKIVLTQDLIAERVLTDRFGGNSRR